ncbi:MAG: peptidoglycan binding protein CsiV [Alkalimonas sp.]|nr:peptidoglycan binding protein CsiV [Alkalimonas sp.]
MKHSLLIIALLGLAAYPASANVIDASRVVSGDRWFEVEMIIFQRQHDNALIEQFSPNDELTPPARYFDLLQALYQPDITPLLRQLERCSTQPTAKPTTEITSSFSHEQPINLDHYIKRFRLPEINALCIFEPQPALWQQPLFANNQWIDDTPLPPRLLQQPVAKPVHQSRPYLVSRDALELTEIAQKLHQQAGIEVLLHSGFRQAPVTDRRSIASRWYAGYDLQRQRLQSEADSTTLSARADSISLRADPLLQRIEQRYQQLSDNGPIRLYRLPHIKQVETQRHKYERLPPLWQLDGFVRVHLDHYLFVNTDFILRQPAEEGAILQHRIQFSRRVISGEIHYIDHPRLGMVVQIRRFQPPLIESDRSNSDQ